MTQPPDPLRRRRPSWRTMAFIFISNLIPVVGVMAFGWNATQILILYWCENLVVGALTLPRILTAQKVLPTRPAGPGEIQIPLNDLRGRGCLGIFFIVHYGIFCLVHGVFAFILARGFIQASASDAAGFGAVWAETFGNGGFLAALLAVALVQGVVFTRDWVLSGLWARSDPGTEMMRPYGRIVVMHLTVLLGAWGLAEIGAPAFAVLILCVVKTAVELGLVFQPKARAKSA